MKVLFRRLLVGLAISVAWFSPAHGALVDWGTLFWVPGSLSQSFDVDPTNPGTDVSVAVTGNIGTLRNDVASGTLTPAITMSLQGGLSPIPQSLEIAADLKTNSHITLTFSFSPQYVKGVSNVGFTILDIDAEGNKEIVRNIYGIALNGTHVPATITLGPAINRTGSGLNQILTGTVGLPNSGPGSGDGNAVVSFGGTPIIGFAFTWANNNGAPLYQNIAITDIMFTPVPELDQAVWATAVCLLVVFFGRKRRNQRSASAS